LADLAFQPRAVALGLLLIVPTLRAGFKQGRKFALKLLLPRADLHGQHALFLDDLIDGLDALEGFQGHAGLKLGTVCSSLSFHRYGWWFYHPENLSSIAYTLAPFSGTASLGSGDLTVSNGAVAELKNSAGAIADTAAVRLTGTGRIHLAAGVTEIVAQLHIDGVLRMPGTWNAARDPLHFSGPGSLVVSSGGAPTPAEAWRFQHFNSYNNSGDSADDADPDIDGAANLLESALGSNHKAGDASGRPIVNPGTPDFSFTYTRSKAATDLMIDVEVSPDLTPASWRGAIPADGTNTLIDGSHPEIETWRFQATTSEPRMFYRLRVR
jgi:hypothetical protein